MNLFGFTNTSPPNVQQFEVIAQRLVARLCDQFDVAFDTTDTRIESRSWVTVKIRSGPICGQLADIVFVGIVSYSLRDTTPSIQSVLLPFSNGKRLTVGRNSILVANYVENLAGGEWEDFIWAVDIYGEWECEELPNW